MTAAEPNLAVHHPQYIGTTQPSMRRTLPTACATSEHLHPSHFTGKERDTESGNDYFSARYYASSMGRWMSPDWSDSATPIPFATLTDPQTLNLYSYVQNRPMTQSDTTGHFTNGLIDWDWLRRQTEQQRQMELAMFQLILRYVLAHQKQFHASDGFISDLFNPTKNCPTCQIGIVPWGFGGTGGMVRGLYGAVSETEILAAASAGGETVQVVTDLSSAPTAGRALSVATGDGASGLAGEASGGTRYVANIPKGLIKLLESKGLALPSKTSMGGSVGQEIKFLPQATKYVIQFFTPAK